MIRVLARAICRGLYRAGVWHALLALERAIGWRRHGVVLLYHHLRADDEHRAPMSQVEEGVRASAFQQQLEAFSKWYLPVEAAALHAALRGDSPLKADALVVTFDDGYRDNRTLAGPLLAAHRAQALVFLATGFIDSPRLFWWVELNDIIRRFSPQNLAIALSSCNGHAELSAMLQQGDVETDAGRRSLRAQIASRLESLPEPNRAQELSVLRQAAGETGETCLPLLNWNELRQMRAEGFEFGAHTVNHPHMTRLSSGEVDIEIDQSCQTIQRELLTPATTFAYPHGDLDDRIENLVQRAGFEAAYAANAGVVTPARTNIYRIPRIQLYAREPADLAVLLVALKASKYFPRLMRPALTRLLGQPFEV